MKKYIKNNIKVQLIKIVILCLIVVIATCINSLLPLILGRIIDYIVFGKIEYIVKSIIIIICFETVVHILAFGESYIGQLITTQSHLEIKRNVFEHILKMNCSDIDSYTRGELINRIEIDCENITDFYINTIVNIFQTMISIIFPIVIIFKTSVSLSLLSLAILPLIYFVNACFSKKIQGYVKKDKDNNDIYISYMNDIFFNIKNIKAYIMEAKVLCDYRVIYEEKNRISKKQTVLNGKISFIKETLENIMSSGIMLFAAILIIKGRLSLGDFVSFNQYISNLNENIKKIMNLHLLSKEVKVSYDRLSILMEKREEEYESNVIWTVHNKSITIKDIEFSYNKKCPVLRNINLEINSPGLYSIVGKNGVGKSTLLKIIIQFYTPMNGIIKLGDKRLNDMSCVSVRSQCTYVSKEKFVMNDTILNNILMGNMQVGMKDVINACRIVGLEQDIQSLPKKYNSIIGKDVDSLSSGQMQKLALVRAVLRNTDIILLDETTSDMDGESEKAVESFLLDLAKSKIIIMVNHRERLLKNSNKIFVMDENTIVDSGTHEYLINNCISYQSLYKQ